jgi:predicted Zn-dependent protease
VTLPPDIASDTYWRDTTTLVSPDDPWQTLPRFNKFPIRIYLPATDAPVWQVALEHVLSQINPLVLMVRTTDPADSDIIIHVLSREDYGRHTGCQSEEKIIGCGRLMVIENINSDGTFSYILRGDIWMAADTQNLEGSLLHEMLHAIGIPVHSSNSRDIMYPYETSQIYLSLRDVNTLQTLYPATLFSP